VGTATCYAMTLALRDEVGVIERYRREHRAVWPAVIKGLRELGVTKERIFLKGNRLFLYLEAGTTFEPADLGRLNEDPECQRWDTLMRTLQEPAIEASAGEWWTGMELVFDLDWFH
jgi:L-rhamnose mutarotase